MIERDEKTGDGLTGVMAKNRYVLAKASTGELTQE